MELLEDEENLLSDSYRFICPHRYLLPTSSSTGFHFLLLQPLASQQSSAIARFS